MRKGEWVCRILDEVNKEEEESTVSIDLAWASN